MDGQGLGLGAMWHGLDLGLGAMWHRWYRLKLTLSGLGQLGIS